MAVPSKYVTGAQQRTATLGFRPDIEGLRGLAVLLVVAFHAKVPGVSGGFVGVDVFFVISGYLISGILITEFAQSGRIDFLRFYARRIRRLLPAAALTIVVTAGASYVINSPIESVEHSKTAVFAALSLSNMWFAWQAQDYFADGSETDPLLHTWSLAAEEQFYLFWPFFLLALYWVTNSGRQFLTVIVCVSLASLLACVYATAWRQAMAFYIPVFRVWEFGIGAIAFLVHRHGFRLSRPTALIGAWSGAAAIIAGGIFIEDGAGFPGLKAVLPGLGTAVVLYCLSDLPDCSLTKLLGSRPGLILGRLSYSWYLWHWPWLTLGLAALGDDLSLGFRVALALCALLCAQISFWILEDRVRHHAFLAPRSVLSICLGGMLAFGAVSVSFSGYLMAKDELQQPFFRNLDAIKTALPYRDRCVAEFLDSDVKECSFGAEDATVSVVLFGDSHALQWTAALEQIANENGWRLVTMLKAACPGASVEVFNPRLGRPYYECSEWRRSAIARIIEINPDITILAAASGYVRRAGLEHGYATLNLGQWGAGNRKTLSILSAAGIPTVLLRDNPRPGFDVIKCLAREYWQRGLAEKACTFDRAWSLPATIANTERTVTDEYSNATYLDLSDHYCAQTQCAAVRDGVVIYRDNNHLSPAFSLALKPELEKAIRQGLNRN